MLQQILEDMYIDPELLDELSEEQKQILFCKMREEQVKRWTVREEEDEKKNKNSKKSPKSENDSNRHVDFLLATDGKEWVWVMGEHKDDKNIEQIMEDEAHEQASTQAEKESEELKLKQQAEALKMAEGLVQTIELTKEEIKRKKDEAEMYETLLEAQVAAQKKDKDRKSSKKRVNEAANDKSQKKLDEIKNRRSNELYFTWKQNRNTLQRDAEESRKKLETEWREQERRVKETERRMREIARRAREEHRRSLQGTVKLISVTGAFKSGHKKGNAPPIPSKSSKDNGFKPLPARPRSREAVIRWFRNYEIPKDTVMDPKTKLPAMWFHGLIGRTEAEELLEDKKTGTFLVRVSERIWGYTISYRASGRCKHFLIDKSEEKYHFFGTSQKEHDTLLQMIAYHMKNPISSEKELLSHPCGQSLDPPDYSELFQGIRTESTTL